MLPDFTIITHKFPERRDIVIYPIADVHLGAAEHNAEAWGAFCRKIEQEENAYLVIAGDLLNNATRSSVSNIFEEVMRPREAKRLMAEMLRPIRHKILACCRGNHCARNRDVDDDPLYDIMCKLDCEHLYRENMAFIRLQFGDPEKDGLRNPTYILAMTHGSGGGVQTGSMVNKGEKTAYFYENIDALIFGHSHKPFITQPAKISVDARNNKVSLKPFKVISCTSWMNYGGYAMQKMMPPVSIAPQTMKLYGKEKKLEVTM